MSSSFTTLRTKGIKGAAATISLMPCTAFVGPNRSGKTALLDALRLALTGRYGGGVNGAAIMKLAPEGETEIEAVIEGPAASAALRVEAPRGKAKRPQHEVAGALSGLSADELQAVLPTQGMRELLELGAAKSREAIFRRFGRATEIPSPASLLDDQQALWDEAVESVRQTLGPDVPVADVAAEVVGWFRRLKRKAGDEARAKEAQVAELAAQGTAEAERIPELERDYKAAVAAEGRAAAVTELRREEQRLADAEQQLTSFETAEPERRAALDQAKAAFDQAEKERAAAEHELAEARDQLENEVKRLSFGTELLAVLERTVAWLTTQSGRVHADCPLCGGTETLDAAARLEVFRPQVESRQASVTAARRTVARAEQRVRDASAASAQAKARAQAAATAAGHEGQRLRCEVSRCREAITRWQAVVQGADQWVGPPAAEIERELQSLRTAEARRQQAAELTRAQREAEARKDLARQLEREASSVLTSLLRDVQESAEVTVNRYMPAGFEARLRIDGSPTWEVVGTDGRSHDRHCMAGSERAALMVALGLAWTEGAPIRVLLIDDTDLAGFSAENVRGFLTKIRDCVAGGSLTQAFVAWSRPDEIPFGWHVVATGTAASAGTDNREVPIKTGEIVL